MGKKDIFALLNLAYRLFIHILKKPVHWITGYKGYDAFVSRYRGLPGVSRETRSVYPALSWCIDCGICVAECGALRHEVPPAYLYVSYSRMLPGLFLSAKLARECADCDTCLVHCPTGVQMKQLMLVYRDMTAAGPEAA